MGSATLRDEFGLEAATDCSPCVDAINAYYEAVLAYRPFPAWSVAANQAIEADPRCPMARVLAADCAFCQGDAAKSKELLEQLVQEAKDSEWSWREKKYVEAWKCWVLLGDPVGCYKSLAEVVAKNPSDLFAVKRGHIMGLILGDGQKMLDIVEISAKEYAKADPPPRYLHGMWAFGLEQQGCYQDAERVAKEGLAFERSLGPDAWLDHGLAHALYFQGEKRLEEAEKFLKQRSGTWLKEALHPFLYTHCWWHLALLHCERRNFEASLAIFDERLWPEGPAGLEQGAEPQVQLNALNLLWRLESREQASALPRWARVLEGCRGLSLPKDGSRGSLQHNDLLLDILLIRALAVAKEDSQSLQEFLSATQTHAEEMAKAAAGADGRAEAYGSLARLVADIFRADLPCTEMLDRRAKAREEVWALRPRWGCLGGSEEQRGILIEAVKGPVVCGDPKP
mmetsp:Transcript_81067/g.194481  ORF Transcript_81067/g.194481 Transcript_81067/m.194481 type:complete len:454 (-) Transcript_81067:14-1375(-)